MDPSADPLLTLAAVGDTHGYRIFESDPSDPLAGVSGIGDDADLFLLNHEGAILPEGGVPGTPFPQQSLFTSSARIVDFLRLGGATVATLANNHVLDAGPEGIAETVAAFTRGGFLVTGAGADGEAARAPARLTVNGVHVAVSAFLAMDPDPVAAGPGTPGAAAWRNGGAETVADLAATSDFVVVAIHLHLAEGWTEVAASEHVAVVEEALAAGADLVIGHGPHVPQGVVVANGGIGLASLGNFLFRPDYELPEVATRSVVAELGIFPDRVDLALRAFRLDAAGRPRVTTSADATAVLGGIAERSAELGTALTVSDGAARLSVGRRRE